MLDCITQVGRNPTARLTSQICAALGVKHAFLFSNGRGAVSFLLRCMAQERTDRRRNAVVIPSYTCYSVAASVLKAGLEIVVCDIDDRTLCFDREQLESIDMNKVLAIVSTNLYGIPDNLSELEALARGSGVHLIDDAAQCLGATMTGRPVGSFGDAGILSFDKGKVVTSINGGVIVTNNDALARLIQEEYQQVPQQKFPKRVVELIKLQAYFFLLNPSLYWIPSNMPFLRLGHTPYEEEYPVERYFQALAPLAVAQHSRISELNEHRRQSAARYKNCIPVTDIIGTISPVEDSDPIYLRFPLRIRHADTRRQFLTSYHKLGCSVSYPMSIADVPEIQNRIQIQNGICNGGRRIASEMVTLPTHAYVTNTDIDTICDGLSRLVIAAGHIERRES